MCCDPQLGVIQSAHLILLFHRGKSLGLTSCFNFQPPFHALKARLEVR
jgi:hypothetical protein